MSLLKVNEVQNYNGSSLTLTASTVSTSAQLNTGGNVSVTGSINVSDDSTTRSNLGLGSIATQDSSNVSVTGGSITGTTIVPTSPFSFRNRIINGDMRIDQRNAGSSYSFAHDGTTSGYTLDRFQLILTNADEYDCTITQYSMSSSEIATTGHSNALKLLTGTAETTVNNDEYLRIGHRIEGQNLQELKLGTASAKSTILSFWVKSSEEGTYGLSLFRYVRSGSARTINLSYTINVADTWEQKTIPITGDTGGDLIPDTNGNGLVINWQLAAGSDWTSTASSSWDDYVTTRLLGNYSNSVATTASATWYLSGVQLEIGSVATPFEHRPISVELSLCQRYFVSTSEAVCVSNINSQYVSVSTRLNPVPMRSTPSLSMSGTYTFNPFYGSGTFTSSNAPSLQRNLSDNFIINFNMGSSTGTSGIGEIHDATLFISAEL